MSKTAIEKQKKDLIHQQWKKLFCFVRIWQSLWAD